MLDEIRVAVDKNLVPRNVGLQMHDTVIETAENILHKSELKEEVRVKMHSNITDTYTWTDYREYYEKREEQAKAAGESAKVIAIAKNAIDMNLPIADIARLTGLSIADIEALKKTL